MQKKTPIQYKLKKKFLEVDHHDNNLQNCKQGGNFPKRQTLCLYAHPNNHHPISFLICQSSAQITGETHVISIHLVQPSLHVSSVSKFRVASHLQGHWLGKKT